MPIAILVSGCGGSQKVQFKNNAKVIWQDTLTLNGGTALKLLAAEYTPYNYKNFQIKLAGENIAWIQKVKYLTPSTDETDYIYAFDSIYEVHYYIDSNDLLLKTDVKSVKGIIEADTVFCSYTWDVLNGYIRSRWETNK